MWIEPSHDHYLSPELKASTRSLITKLRTELASLNDALSHTHLHEYPVAARDENFDRDQTFRDEDAERLQGER